MKKFTAIFCVALALSNSAVFAASGTSMKTNSYKNGFQINYNINSGNKLKKVTTKCKPSCSTKTNCNTLNKWQCNNNQTNTTQPTTQKYTEASTETSTETSTKVIIEASTETSTETSTNVNNNSNNQSTVNVSIANQVLSLVNQERAKNNLKPLTLNNELSNVAQKKSEDMRDKNYFDHTSPTYGTPFNMMKSFGISYKYAGENIAKGQKTPEKVVDAWMNSEGHRKNILSANFTEMGLGYAVKGNTTYWTQMFISK